jgi:hypothetical protein
VAMCRTPAEVPDRLRDSLLEHLTLAQLTEVAATVAWENHRARINRALGARTAGFPMAHSVSYPTAGRVDPGNGLSAAKRASGTVGRAHPCDLRRRQSVRRSSLNRGSRPDPSCPVALTYRAGQRASERLMSW